MAIPLPDIRLPKIALPPAPAMPPTHQDVYNALRLRDRVKRAHEFPGARAVAKDIASVEDVANANIYLHRVLNAAANIQQ